jgi:hypothetical protein
MTLHMRELAQSIYEPHVPSALHNVLCSLLCANSNLAKNICLWHAGDELHLTHVVLRLGKYEYPEADKIIEKGHNPYAILEECKEVNPTLGPCASYMTYLWQNRPGRDAEANSHFGAIAPVFLSLCAVHVGRECL